MTTDGKLLLLAVVVPLALSAHAGAPFNNKPTFVAGRILESPHDGVTDDLLTAGPGQTGLQDGSPPPGFADPQNPTACASLHGKGLLGAVDVASQAEEAQAIINSYGIVPEQNIVQASHWWANVSPGIAVTYANAYGRASVLDNLCGYSMGATDGATSEPVALSSAGEQAQSGTSNGIPPTAGVNLINNLSAGGAKENRASISPSTGNADQNVDGAVCLRSLTVGRDVVTGGALIGKSLDYSERIAHGIDSIRASGDLGG